MQKSIDFTNRGQRIFGSLHIPEAPHEPPFPGVVMLHGFTGNKIEKHQLFVKAARRFAGEGVLALRFDFRGCGESEGLFEELSVEGMIDDARAALRFVRERRDVSGDRVALLGMSLGGSIASAAAGTGEAEVRCLVLWAAVADLSRAFYSFAPDEIVAGYGKKAVYDYFGNALSQKLIDELVAFNPVERVRSYSGPVLVVHGEADDHILPDDAVRFRDALEDRGPVELHIVGGADHTFASLGGEKEIIDKTLQFLKSELFIPS